LRLLQNSWPIHTTVVESRKQQLYSTSSTPQHLAAQMKGQTMSYQVIDRQTQQVVATFVNKQAARNKRDRLDAAYGAVRYAVREVQQ
jgi:hypothetical protein